MTNLNVSATPTNGAAMDPMQELRDQVTAAQAESDEVDPVVTIADVAAAAFTALETVVAILPQDQAAKVVADFEEKAAAFNVAFEEDQRLDAEEDAGTA